MREVHLPSTNAPGDDKQSQKVTEPDRCPQDRPVGRCPGW